jgi:hypothetical protein
MKIINDKAPTKQAFKYAVPGDIFLYDSGYYLKIKEKVLNVWKYNAICLSSYDILFIGGESEGELISNSELHLK